MNSLRIKRGTSVPPVPSSTSDASTFAPYELGWSTKNRNLYICNAIESSTGTEIEGKKYTSLDVIPTMSVAPTYFCVDMTDILTMYNSIFTSTEIGTEPTWKLPWE